MAGISVAHKFVFAYKDMQIIMSESRHCVRCVWSAFVSLNVYAFAAPQKRDGTALLIW